MVFVSIREHANTAIFLRARAEIKYLLCEQRAASSLESTTREQRAFLIFSACSNPYGNPFLLNKTENFLKRRCDTHR